MDYCEKIFGIKKELIPDDIYKEKIDELFINALSCKTLIGLEFLKDPTVIDHVELLDKERFLDYILNNDDIKYFMDLRLELITRYAEFKFKVVQAMDNPNSDIETYLNVRSN